LKSDADKLNADIEAGLRSEKTKKPKMTEPIKDTSKQVLQPGS
jgi:outer membrane receptor for monomeric catechols